MLVVVLVALASAGGARAAGPGVTGIAPGSGPATGGTAVTITGTGLGEATRVTFGGAAATFTIDSDVRIRATAPPGSGAVAVVVTTPTGSSTGRFSYTPVIARLSPAGGTVSGDSAVTIDGAGLAGVARVTFGGEAAEFSVDSDSRITATSPPGRKGPAAVRVTGPTGSDSAPFTYLLSLDTLSPSVAPTAGGTIHLGGIGFATAEHVRFGDSYVGYAALDDTELIVTVPPGSGAVDVWVEGPYGKTDRLRFEYVDPDTPGANASGSASSGSGFPQGKAPAATVPRAPEVVRRGAQLTLDFPVRVDRRATITATLADAHGRVVARSVVRAARAGTRRVRLSTRSAVHGRAYRLTITVRAPKLRPRTIVAAVRA